MTINANEAAIVVAVIAAFGSIGAAVIGLLNRGKLDIIHVLVNSNLTDIKRQLGDALTTKEAAEAEVQRLRDNAATQHNAADHPEITKGG